MDLVFSVGLRRRQRQCRSLSIENYELHALRLRERRQLRVAKQPRELIDASRQLNNVLQCLCHATAIGRNSIDDK
jgi:hypothetical protein